MSEPLIRSRVRLPADVELEDKLAFGLTARQLLLLGGAAVLIYGLYTVASSVLPLPVAAALCAPFAITGTVLALGRRDGLPADRLARLAVRYLVAPRRRLLAPDGIPAPLPGSPKRASAAAIDLPIRMVLRSGLVDLADGSFCVLLRAAAGSFGLKSEEEQAALVEAFGRFLNGVTHSKEPGSYWRDAFGRGLVIGAKVGVNPFKDGAVSSPARERQTRQLVRPMAR